jgi:hypothetical protein
MNENKLKIIAVVFVFTLTLTSIAFSAPQSKPNGPWITPKQNLSLEGFESYEQLVKKLKQIEKRAKGIVELEPVAETGEDRKIWLVKIGDETKTPVFIWTQQHGNEPHGTEAAVDLIKWLVAGGEKAQMILDELYVLIIPRVNPDGSELFTRGNADFDVPPRNSNNCYDDDGNLIGPLDEGLGVFTTTFRDPRGNLILDDDGNRIYNYDINRYHWLDWSQSWQIQCNPTLGGRHYDPDLNPVPEALAVRKVFDDFMPIWGMDVHNLGTSVVNEDIDPEINRPGRMVTGSILWPTNEDVAEEARNLSKQMCIVIKKRSMELGNMELTNYARVRSDGSFSRGGGFPGIARNAYGLIGTEWLNDGATGPLGGSILVEIRGQGQKSLGMLKNNAREIMEVVLEKTADGSLFAVNPSEADSLLPIGTDTSIGNPRSEGDEVGDPE